MCCFRWCGRQLCLRNIPISGVNSTPRPTAVYASDPASPRRPQNSLPSRLLGFERTRLSLANSFQLPLAPRTGLLPEVGRDRARRGHVRSADPLVGGERHGCLCPVLRPEHPSSSAIPPTEPPSLRALRRRSSRVCSGASSVLRGSSDPSPVPRQLRLLAFLPRPGIAARDCGPDEVSQVPTRSFRA